jgi:hypothetical protein
MNVEEMKQLQPCHAGRIARLLGLSFQIPDDLKVKAVLLRSAMRFWAALTTCLALAMLSQHTAFALDLGKTGAALGLQPSDSMFKAVASINETFAPTALAFSPDGNYLADTGMYEPIVHVWDVHTHSLVRTLPGGKVVDFHSITWSRNGRYLAACDNYSRRQSVTIWSTTTWTPVIQLNQGSGQCLSPAFSGDSTLFAYGDVEGDIYVYDTTTWKLVNSAVYAYEPGKNKCIPVKCPSITVLQGKQVTFIPSRSDLAFAVDGLFAEDNPPAAIKSLDFVNTNRLVLWNPTQPPPNLDHPNPQDVLLLYGKQPLLAPDPRSPGAPRNRADPILDAIAFAPDGQTFATGTRAGDVKIWNLHPFREIAHPLRGAFPIVAGGAATLQYTSDGTHLLVIFDGIGFPYSLGKLVAINARTDAVEDILPVSNYGALAYSGKNHLVATGGAWLGRAYRIFIWKFR